MGKFIEIRADAVVKKGGQVERLSFVQVKGKPAKMAES